MKKYYLFLIAAFFLVIAAIFWNRLHVSSFSEEAVVRKITSNLTAQINSLKTEIQLLEGDWSVATHSFFLIENNRFAKWNRTTPVIEVAELQGNFEWKLIRNSSGDQLVCKKSVSDSSFVVGVIPIRTGYRLTNQYLNATWNEKIFPVKELQIYPIDSSNGSLVCIEEVGCLFKVKLDQHVQVENSISVYLILIAAILVIVFVYGWVSELTRARKYVKGFFFLFFSLAIARVLMVSLSFPSVWIYSKYFDPRNFASSTFSASVGDFFLNSLIVAVASVYFLFVFSKSGWLKRLRSVPDNARFIFSVLLFTAAFFSFLFPHLFIEAIFHDSSIVLDISKSVQFDGVKLLALGAFILSGISSFCFVHCLIRISRSIASDGKLLLALLLSAVIFIGYFIFSELEYWSVFIFGAGYFLLLSLFGLPQQLIKFNKETFVYFLTATVIYSLMTAWDVRTFSDERTTKALLRSASSLVGNDELGEYLLDQTKAKIANDLVVLSSLENPLLSKRPVKQKISEIYLGDYFDRYDVGINLFLADGSPADAQSEIDFASSIRAIQSTANRTNYESIYWIQTKNPRSLKRYVLIVPLVKNNANVGYVVLDFSLKRIVTNRVYPELLTDNRFNQTYFSKDFSYALFNNESILDQNGSINFDQDFRTTWLNDRILYSKGVATTRFLFVAAEDELGRKIVLGAERSSVFSVLANFSFFFVLGIVLILVVWIFAFGRSLKGRKSFNFSAQIQLLSYLSLAIPLVAVSLIALRMIVNSSDSQFEKELMNKGVSLSESFLPSLEKSKTDSVSLGLKELVSRASQITGIDVNLYLPTGELTATSQPLIFSNALLLPLIDARALNAIVHNRVYTVKINNNVGSLAYSSSYFPIRSSKTGALLAILELPFFSPKDESAQSNVVSNILVTFVFVFLFFSFFSFKVVSRLTAPLVTLAKKLSSTSFSTAQPMEWTTEDEIGELVKQYNQMLKNLERSKAELAQREKEKAWRDIAKQVAHEIKNPLTPMKLTLQQLEQKWLTGDLKSEKAHASIQTLLTQVDTLDGIASSFSTFASMPAPQTQQVDLVALLDKTALLFQDHSLGSVSFSWQTDSIFVEADEKLLGRIVSNIILNALQSDGENKVTVEIGLIVHDHFVTLYVKDNGPGISAELKSKIFLPHFSTKATGAGLGLAIAKQGVEQMEGTIWFESTPWQGTCFFIKLKRR